MAEPSNLLNPREQKTLQNSVTGQNQFNLGGMGFDVPSAVTSVAGTIGNIMGNNPLVSNVGSLANIARGTYTENLASKVVNPEQNIFSSIAKSSLPSFISGKSSLDTMKDRADMNRDGKVDNTEYNAYSYNFGKNLGVPTVQRTNLTPMGDISKFNNPFENRSVTPSIYSQQEVSNLTSGIGKGVGATGDLGGSTGSGYGGSTSFLGFGSAEGVNESGPTGLGNTKQTGEQVSIKNTQDLSKSFADDQASSSDSSTYICTALYEMGDMKKSIYKYDQIYGKKVNPATYRGYELWGKYVALKLRNKGIIYKVAKPIALAWANQMAYDLSKGRVGKNSLAIQITKTVGEGICYTLGQIFKRRQLWLKSQ